MNNNNGYLVVSFLLYLMIFSLITVFTCHIITSLLLPSFTTNRQCASLIGLHIASDLFVRDIRIMRNGTYAWKRISADELIWQSNGNDIGWLFIRDRLERREGIYHEGWSHKKTSIVATGLKKVTFSAKKADNCIVGIEMTLIPVVHRQKPIICYVAVNRP